MILNPAASPILCCRTTDLDYVDRPFCNGRAAASVAHAGADGVHLSLDSHKCLARLIADQITDVLNR